jgi:hypothetical protein
MSSSRLLGLVLLAALTLVGCAQAAQPIDPRQPIPTQTPLPIKSRAATPDATGSLAQGGGAVTPELVGTWTQDSAGSSTFFFSRRAYQFTVDGTYALLDLICSQDSNGTSCEEANPPEAGAAVVNGNQLSLNPTTQSTDGPRTYTFAVVRDPNMGDLRLQFLTPDYVDEWFFQP